MSQVLVLEETLFTQLLQIENQYDSLKISNQSDIKVDANALTEHLKLIKGIDQIEELTINYNSSLNDLSVLQAFTNLKSLFIYGQQINTLEGIEWFNKGEYIQVQTYRNRRRDISQISQSTIKYIDLFVERVEDLSAIAGCKYLQKLNIYQSMEPDFAEWEEAPFERISFKRCKFKELGHTSAASQGLQEISVLGCRSLERFTGDNSNIRRLVVEGSKKLDLCTLKTFKGIEVLIVNSCTKEMNLKEIGGLEFVRHIDFILCKVEVDLIDLKEIFPSLESLHISGMKEEYGLQLKQLNPEVRITSRSFEL